MDVFRLTRRKYGKTLSAAGAAIRGGRWNSRGTEVIYTAGNRALAMAEVAVYLTLHNLPDDYIMLTIELPSSIEIKEVTSDLLPPQWNVFPHLKATQEIGDRFVREKINCVLKVPSAVVPGDYNYLINPAHPSYDKINIYGYHAFPFDPRLF